MADEELVRYVADAKRAGAREHAVTATHMLLFKHEARMLARVRLRLPTHLQHQAQTVADWVLERVTRSALKLPVRGESVGEWVNWWGAAIDRQVISFWRTTQGQALEKQSRLPAEHQGEDDAPADDLGEDFDVDRVIAQASIAEALEAAVGRMDNAEHVAILRRAMLIWDDQPSKLVAEEFGTTAMNVDQIKSRFRTLVREECELRGWEAS
jgi:hypothetical protein